MHRKISKELTEALSVINGCVLVADRIAIPSSFQLRVLQQIHRGHPGIERTKAIARSYVYWPNIDKDIENFVKKCHGCASAAKLPIKTTRESWPVPSSPMERIHVDIAGPVNENYYLVIVDAYSKWPEIFLIKQITTSEVIGKLRSVFSRYGDAKRVVTDNGTQFTSVHFKTFLESRGIKHSKTAPYHPQSNGQAERFVDTLKRALKKLQQEGTSEEILETFLQTYRATPNKNLPNGVTPAELFVGRKIETVLDLLKPEKPSSAKVNEKQNQQFNCQHGAKRRQYDSGDLVYAQIFKRNKWHWAPGKIIERIGTVNYNVLVTDAGKQRLIRSHTNQLRNRINRDVSLGSGNGNLTFDILCDTFNIPGRSNESVPTSPFGTPTSSTSSMFESASLSDTVIQVESTSPAPLVEHPSRRPDSETSTPFTVRTRSGREVIPPRYLRDYAA